MPRHPILIKLAKGPEIARKLCSFSKRTKIPLQIMDSRGEKLWESDVCESKWFLCKIFGSNGYKDKTCLNAHKKAIQESIRWGEATIRNCCYSLMQITAPIMDDGKLLGYLLASPFLLVAPSELQPEELPPSWRNGDKKRSLSRVVSSIPVLKDDKASWAARTLYDLAEKLSYPNLNCLAKIHEIHELQGKISDQIRDLKALDENFDTRSLSKLSYMEEKEIISRIRLGDRNGAKEILYRILAINLCQYLESFELLKISVLELLIFLSRAAVESGGKIEEMLGLRYRFLTELAGIKDQENLCLWVVKVFEKLIETIYQTRHVKNYERLKKALDFIESNYNQPLKVEEVARGACLSPSRLSHIIKDELGITLVDHIIKVRVDKAKTLLRNGELPISEIALEVGFPDQSYFTKVFKKVEKCTPKAFRQTAFQSSASAAVG
jgi:two-component system response regulator YesN